MKLIWNEQVKVSVLAIEIFVATWLNNIQELALAEAVELFQFQNNQNSLCVQVATHAAKNAEIYQTAHENVVESWALLWVSVQSCVSDIAGAVVLLHNATYKLSHISVVLSHDIWAAKAIFATVGIRLKWWYSLSSQVIISLIRKFHSHIIFNHSWFLILFFIVSELIFKKV